MPKALTIAGMTVAALVVVLFGFDLAFGQPFSKAGIPMDIIFLVCAAGAGLHELVDLPRTNLNQPCAVGRSAACAIGGQSLLSESPQYQRS